MRSGEHWAREFEVLIHRSEGSIRLGEQTERDIVWRLYDLIEYGGVGTYAPLYLDLIEKVYAKDNAQFDFAATRAAMKPAIPPRAPVKVPAKFCQLPLL